LSPPWLASSKFSPPNNALLLGNHISGTSMAINKWLQQTVGMEMSFFFWQMWGCHFSLTVSNNSPLTKTRNQTSWGTLQTTVKITNIHV
jgi:hypothetical protein